MIDELRALDSRLLSLDPALDEGFAALLRQREQLISKLRLEAASLPEWLELEANGEEIGARLRDYRQQVARNLEAAEQEFRRLQVFRCQEMVSLETGPREGGLIDRFG